MRVAVDDLPIAAFAVGGDLRIRAFNGLAEAVTGWSRTVVLGRPCHEVLGCEVVAGGCPLLGSWPVDGGPVELFNRLRDPAGRMVRVTAHATSLDGDRPDAGCLVVLATPAAAASPHDDAARSQDPVLVWRSPVMRRLVGIAERAARVDSTLLIQGEPGTGKELIARFVHSRSRRSDGPFVAIDGGAIPETLAESELFGHVRGAFTDARTDRPGRFAQAAGGTLLFDEIGEMPEPIQVKLLRVLEEREFTPLGGRDSITADIRIIAATNRHLTADVRSGRFRRDLYDRLNVVRIDIPPLRQRPEDLRTLVDHWVRVFNRRHGRTIRGLAADAWACLASYPFPGNVRELKNAIEHAFVLAEADLITLADLPEDVAASGRPSSVGSVPPLEAAQAPVIREALRRHHGNRTRAAHSLGVSRNTLWRKMRTLGIE